MSFRKYPGGIVSTSDLRIAISFSVGGLLVACIPPRLDATLISPARRCHLYLSGDRNDTRLTRVKCRMEKWLKPYLGELDYKSLARSYLEVQFEDLWGRYRESLANNWNIKMQVIGLDRLRRAQERGNGVILWGMSFYGTLLPKMALAREGHPYSQLSVSEHGCSRPITWFGIHVTAPLYCVPENRYLRERVKIPINRGPGYIKTLLNRLGKNGCVYISAERLNTVQPVVSAVLGRPAAFPTGAPSLAASTNATLLPVVISRNAQFDYTLTIQKPIDPESRGTRKRWIRESVKEFSERLESRVLNEPQGWHWESSWVKSL